MVCSCTIAANAVSGVCPETFVSCRHESHEERAKRFVQLQTLKEAYVKAYDQGISAAPGVKGFCILLQPDTAIGQQIQHVTASRPADTAYRIGFQSDHDSKDWAFMLFDLSGRHTAALCWQQVGRASELERHESTDSTVSASTVYASEPCDAEARGRDDRAENSTWQPCIVHRAVLPLVDTGVKMDCYVQGASKSYCRSGGLHKPYQ